MTELSFMTRTNPYLHVVSLLSEFWVGTDNLTQIYLKHSVTLSKSITLQMAIIHWFKL